jgi:catechol 2,3-dioxygenase-like lactoylglutathione lyase family enzyme
MSVLDATTTEAELGPAKFQSMAHVSLPCRDLEEAIAFYVDVLGGELRVSGKIFASVRLAGINIGVGNQGCSFMEPSSEYPHLAFYLGPDELLHTKAWLEQCGIPTSNLWTRRGKEVLMFFRDPSGNVIELFCKEGIKDADKLPRGPSRGHGTAVDIDAIRYDTWRRPKKQGSRVVTPDRGN